MESLLYCRSHQVSVCRGVLVTCSVCHPGLTEVVELEDAVKNGEALIAAAGDEFGVKVATITVRLYAAHVCSSVCSPFPLCVGVCSRLRHHLARYPSHHL